MLISRGIWRSQLRWSKGSDETKYNLVVLLKMRRSNLKFLKRLVLGKRSDSDNYIKHLRKKGVLVGENCKIFSPLRTVIDEQNPHMLEIGNNVKITSGVTILTHDFSWCVTSGIEGHALGGIGRVKIGNNVFIGMNSTILKGADIEDNVIIGANSLVTGKCVKNSVYAGSPAKRIADLDTYYEKRKAAQIGEAKEIACQYYKRTGKLPTYEILREYIFLFKKCDDNAAVLSQIIKDSGHEDLCVEYYSKSTPVFDSLEAFFEACHIEGEGQ